jgi:hypothetical protein
MRNALTRVRRWRLLLSVSTLPWDERCDELWERSAS